MTKHNGDAEGSTPCSSWRAILLDPMMAGERIAVGVAGVNTLGAHLVLRIFDPRLLAGIIGVHEAQALLSLINSGLRVVEDRLGQSKILESLSEDVMKGLHFGHIESYPSADLESILLGASRISGFLGGVSHPHPFYPSGSAFVGHA